MRAGTAAHAVADELRRAEIEAAHAARLADGATHPAIRDRLQEWATAARAKVQELRAWLDELGPRAALPSGRRRAERDAA